MKSTSASFCFLVFAHGAAMAATNLVSVGVNFLDDAIQTPLAAGTIAGAVPQANWNNSTPTATGNLANLAADFSGLAAPTPISINWSGSPNTWASTGRGEENNGFSPGGDRDLMTGYIDTNDVSTTTVTMSGIPAPYSTVGYDVYVYMLGGVPGRGGAYTIGGTTLHGDSATNPSVHSRDLGVNHTDAGTYLLFPNVTGASFTLSATGDFGGPPRAPINAIQIVEIPEPATAGLLALGLTLAARRRRA